MINLTRKEWTFTSYVDKREWETVTVIVGMHASQILGDQTMAGAARIQLFYVLIKIWISYLEVCWKMCWSSRKKITGFLAVDDFVIRNSTRSCILFFVCALIDSLFLYGVFHMTFVPTQLNLVYSCSLTKVITRHSWGKYYSGKIWFLSNTPSTLKYM